MILLLDARHGLKVKDRDFLQEVFKPLEDDEAEQSQSNCLMIPFPEAV
jgi:hypothetical protein